VNEPDRIKKYIEQKEKEKVDSKNNKKKKKR